MWVAGFSTEQGLDRFLVVRRLVKLHGMRHAASEIGMIRKLKSGEFRIYSRQADKKTGKRKNLGTFASREAAEKHERAIQYFKHG